jgi:LysM repeat protein
MDNRDYNCMMYIIKQGDTLYSISRHYNVPLSLILRVNPYVDIYNLQIGDELCIPVMKPVTWNNMVEYVVEDEDTFQSILDKFGLELEDMLQFNNLNDMQLKPGSTIQLPAFDV